MSERYEGKTRKEWAPILGVTPQTMSERCKKLGSLEAAVKMGGKKDPSKCQGKLFTLGDITQNKKQWALHFKVSYNCFSERCRERGFRFAVEWAKNMHDRPMSNNKAKDLLRGKPKEQRKFMGRLKTYGGEITEGQSLLPIKKHHFGYGVIKLVGYEEENAGVSMPVRKMNEFSAVVIRGLEREAIKCAETLKTVCLPLCQICTVRECMLNPQEVAA